MENIKLTGVDNDILKLLKEKGKVRSKDIPILVGHYWASVYWSLRKLIHLGLVEKEIEDSHNVYYKLKEKGR